LLALLQTTRKQAEKAGSGTIRSKSTKTPQQQGKLAKGMKIPKIRSCQTNKTPKGASLRIALPLFF